FFPSSLLPMPTPPPPSTLFPYTTLFRSPAHGGPQRDALPRPRLSARGGGGVPCRRRRPRRLGRHRPALRRRQDHRRPGRHVHRADRKSTRLNSSHVKISYAVFCLKKKTK